MLVFRAVVVVCFCAAFAGLHGAAANARTPTPASTSTPAVLPAATAPAPQPAVFGGSVWVNARRVADRGVTAKIGDVVCATARAPFVTPPGGGGPTYGLAVPSDEVLPGCGREGATVTFLVGDQQALQAVVWHAGEDMRVDLIIGHPFAYFEFVGVTSEIEQTIWTGGGRLVPFLADRPCGYGEVVYSNEQEPGCGVEGSQVAFKLLDAQGNVIAVANEKGTWHAWDGVSDPQRLDLTFGPATVITMPGTGTGDGAERATIPWGPLALALASLGLAGGMAALRVRRRS